MTKIMLVEDDKSLREIYGVRLLAEGYDIVSAGDGEEALAMAIKERPQLIISDVMMPKVSGYDMLDILRSTTETKNIRVIMMTALSSEEQRLRAESLGADRYLVKSQVGIEDVVRVVHEVLEDTPETMAAAVKANSAPSPSTPPPAPTPQPAMPAVAPTPLPQPGMPMPSAPSVPPVFATPSMPAPAAGPTPVKSQSSAPKPASLKTRIIQPLHDPSIAPVNINDLLDKELAKEAGLTGAENVVVETAEQEKASINEQLQSFVPPEPTPVEAPVDTLSTPVATPNPTLLPTPGVATVPVPAPPVVMAQQPVAVPRPSPVVPQSAPVTSVAPVVAPRPAAPPVPTPVTPLPPVPPAPQVPLAPVVSRPAVTPLPVAVVAPTTSTPPTAPAAATPAVQAVPPAPVVPSSEPVIDLTKLPEVPKV